MQTLRMPQRSKSVQEATVGRWKKTEGDRVKKGDVLAEAEAADALYELQAASDGLLLKIIAPEGTVVPVNAPIALVGKKGEDVEAALAELAEQTPPAPADVKPAQPVARTNTSAPQAPTQSVGGASSAAVSSIPQSAPPDGVIPVLMPQPGQSVEECTIVAWRVKEGDRINVGDVICDLETDKATVEFEAPDAGRLSRIVVQEEQIADVLTPIAYLSDDDTTVDAYLSSTPATPTQAPTQSVGGASPAAASPAASPAAASVTTPTGRIKASPAARKLAAQQGLDLATIPAGSGPGGRILSTDLAEAKPATAKKTAGKPAAQTAPETGITPGPSPEGNPTIMGQPKRIKMSGMRKAIARNLQHSKQAIPHFYIKQAIRAEALLAAYAKLKAAAEFKCTINDFVVAAVAKAVSESQPFRCRIDGTDLLEYPNVNVGIAVGVENGLVVPVVKEADTLSFRDLAAATRQVVESARGGKPENMGQGVFTITNMGMFKISEFLAIVNPPEAAILAVGAAADVPVVEDGKVVAAKVMNVILSVDHRIIDGVLAAEFVNRLKELLEAPQQLLA